ncbi:MAG: hypothetical protein ABSE56_02225 [Bryobacteraceae bacterium]|jgi:hypothetical protein
MGVSRKGQKPEAAGAEKTVKKRRSTKAKLVSNVIKKIEAKLNADELKPTVGDLFRLLQLEKELEAEQPKEIKVLWVEPDEKEHAPEE